MMDFKLPASENLACLSVYSGTSDIVLSGPHIRVPTELFSFQRIYLHLSIVTDSNVESNLWFGVVFIKLRRMKESKRLFSHFDLG